MLQQSNDLESKNKQIEVEIVHLQAQIKELETLLDTHRCFPASNNNHQSTVGNAAAAPMWRKWTTTVDSHSKTRIFLKTLTNSLVTQA